VGEPTKHFIKVMPKDYKLSIKRLEKKKSEKLILIVMGR
jgi:hypothetical protein